VYSASWRERLQQYVAWLMIELSDCPRTAGCSSQISVELALLGELASSAPSMTATFYIVSDAKTDRERERERQRDRAVVAITAIFYDYALVSP